MYQQGDVMEHGMPSGTDESENVHGVLFQSPRTLPLMSDVARLARVSKMTVSRVLNDHASVSPETRARVLEAIRRLQYRPNTAARTLATRRSLTIGVLASDTSLYGPATCIHAIEHSARDAGYFVSIATVRQDDQRSIQQALETLVAQAVEALVIVTPRASLLVAIREHIADIPVVVAGGSPSNAALLSIPTDQEAGGFEATNYLLSLGHETVWHVAGPDDLYASQARLRGWQSALSKVGAFQPPILQGDWSAASGFAAGNELARQDDVTAVFVANDQMALGLMLALKQSGRRIPEDISVIGFDDVPEAAYFDPPLTTMRLNFEDLGRRTLELLLGCMHTGSGKSGKPVVPEFISRSSVRPLKRTFPACGAVHLPPSPSAC